MFSDYNSAKNVILDALCGNGKFEIICKIKSNKIWQEDFKPEILPPKHSLLPFPTLFFFTNLITF